MTPTMNRCRTRTRRHLAWALSTLLALGAALCAAAVPAASAAASPQHATDVAVGSTGLHVLDPLPVADPETPGAVIDSGRDEPDPFLLTVHGVHYLFTSQGNERGNPVPLRSARSLGHWGPVVKALPVVPKWAVPGFTWAPDVHRFGHRWVLYFTAVVRSTNPSIECIGAAVGSRPGGPYVARSQPFICQLDHQGSIDPRTFVDPYGKTYMIWKSDDNANGASAPTSIFTQRLSADGLHLLGSASRIFGPDQPWQGTIVESPDMVTVNGSYWLFYSGNWFNSTSYAIGAARCASPLGPCADVTTQPLLASNAQGAGPGEESVYRDGAGVWLLYSPFRYNSFGYSPPRPVLMARLGFNPAGPYLGAAGPIVSPHGAPKGAQVARG
jgi:beta-xylosidase